MARLPTAGAACEQLWPHISVVVWVSKSWVAGRISAMPTARIWRRYGHLRIYISAGDVELGWCDPRSGRFQLHQPAMAENFWLAVRAEGQRLVQEGQLADVALPAAAIVEPAQQLAGPPARPRERAPEPQPPAQPPHRSAARPAPAVKSGPDDTHWIVRDPQWDDLATTRRVSLPGPGRRNFVPSTPFWSPPRRHWGSALRPGHSPWAREANERSGAS